MSDKIVINTVDSGKDMRDFINFPWKIYQEDPNWVPPLIADRRKQLDPAENAYLSEEHHAFYLARRGRNLVGIVAAFIDHSSVEHLQEEMGGFGFFEVVEDYEVAEKLLDAACKTVEGWGMKGIRGPTNFGIHNEPGFLLKGHDTPPASLEAHSPLYYAQFAEQYGMQKYRDLYAWRANLAELDENLESLPQEILRVFEVISKRSGVTIRKINMNRWDQEVILIHKLFNETLEQLQEHVPMSLEAFRDFATEMKPILDPDLVLFAEMEGKTVGFIVAFPDPNQLLHKLNGRLYPLGWLKMLWFRRKIDQVTFKLFGVREEYRRRGIDTLLYFEAIKEAKAKGYRWLDGSTTSEFNPAVVRMAERLGAERYKLFRLYQKTFE